MKPRTKKCTCCGETKPREAFYLNRRAGDYLRDECAACWDSAQDLTPHDVELIKRLDAYRQAEIDRINEQLDAYRRAEIAKINEQLGLDALAMKFHTHRIAIKVALKR